MASGCGQTVVDSTNDTGGGGSGASGASGGTGGSGLVGGTGGTGGLPNECAAYQDEQGLGAVTVRFVNDSPMTIYLPASCDLAPMFEMTPAGGDDEVSYVYDQTCLQTCEDLQIDPQMYCGACAPAAIELPVGASREVVWAGTGLDWVEMPQKCWFEGNTGGGCGQMVSAPPGGYLLDAMGYSDCEECQCDDGGECWGYPEGFEAYADPAKMTFPQQSLVEIVFGPCAFGCADS